MKKNNIISIINIALITIFVFLLIVSLSFFYIDYDKKQKKEYNESHNYIDTVVKEKYYTNGYCWMYGCYPTSFIIVSTQETKSGIVTWTTNVTEGTYNSYDIGDILVICETHKKIKEGE